MTIKTALSSQFGIADEVTYGVPVAPTRFWPLREGSDGLSFPDATHESDSIYAGARVSREAQRSPGRVAPAGDVGMELFAPSIGLLFKHMFGTVNTSGAGPYTHTYTPGDLTGKSFTAQSGRTYSGDGTVYPFTYSGCKVASWEIACEEGAAATLGVSIIAKDEILYRTVADGATTNSSPTVTSATAVFDVDDLFKPISGTGIPANSYVGVVNSATSVGLSSSNTVNTPVNATATGSGVTLTLGFALTAVSYASSLLPFMFWGATVTLAGSTFKTKSLKLAGDNGLGDERNFLGSRTRDEPLEAGLRAYTGQLDSEFFDIAPYRRFTRGATGALVVAFTRGSHSLTITENIRATGSTPVPDDRGPIPQEIPFEAIGTTTDASAVTAVLVNGDSTP